MAVGLEKGDRVELIAVPGDSDYCRLFRLREGQAGAVELTDSQGTIHVRWDSGRRVGILGSDRALLRQAP
jgi:hypothetical protein